MAFIFQLISSFHVYLFHKNVLRAAGNISQRIIIADCGLSPANDTSRPATQILALQVNSKSLELLLCSFVFGYKIRLRLPQLKLNSDSFLIVLFRNFDF